MIIGHGDIASVLIDRDDVLFFAAGVSNSNETRDSEYLREYELMAQQRFDKHIVYFSSLCVFLNPDTVYAKHKREMEELIKQCRSYSIVRLGNIEWGVNPHTWINYLRAHPDAEVKEVWRHVVSAHEFLYWMDKIRVGEKEEMNIPGQMVWVPDYVKKFRP